jgi:hypothetical protein
MRLGALIGAGVMLAAAAAGGQPAALPKPDSKSASVAAIAAIRKLGGEVKVAEGEAGEPVTVVLTGAKQPAECVPHLAKVANLRQCDL